MGIFDAYNGQSASEGSGWGIGSSASQAWSNTAGREASVTSQMAATQANASALQAWREAAEYNAKEAQRNREWQEYMANTQYQRSIEDMKKAGLNPILAASNGISGASIGSGAQASMSNPTSFMGQTFAESNSASASMSESKNEYSNSSWSKSDSGLATALTSMSNLFMSVVDKISSSNKVESAMNDVKSTIDNMIREGSEKIPGVKTSQNFIQNLIESLVPEKYRSKTHLSNSGERHGGTGAKF